MGIELLIYSFGIQFAALLLSEIDSHGPNEQLDRYSNSRRCYGRIRFLLHCLFCSAESFSRFEAAQVPRPPFYNVCQCAVAAHSFSLQGYLNCISVHQIHSLGAVCADVRRRQSTGVALYAQMPIESRFRALVGSMGGNDEIKMLTRQSGVAAKPWVSILRGE